jgi:hypothetical protein
MKRQGRRVASQVKSGDQEKQSSVLLWNYTR